jgi:hypothetical protein
MAEPISPAVISNLVENSGAMGGIAAAIILATWALDEPAAISAVPNGFVMSKTIPVTEDGPSPQIGLSDLIALRSTGSAMSVTLGVYLENDEYTSINLMLTVGGQDGQSGAEIVFGKELLTKADPDVSPEGHLVGYKNAGQEFAIPFPSLAIEFAFEMTPEVKDIPLPSEEDDGIDIIAVPDEIPEDEPEEDDSTSTMIASVYFHGVAKDGIIQPAMQGVLPLHVNAVAVLPWAFNIGLMMDTLILDWSDEGESELQGLFPGIYGAAWKGFAAKRIAAIIPIPMEDQATPDFLVFDAKGLLYDSVLETFSVKLSIDYTNGNPDGILQNVHGDIELIEGNLVKSTLRVWFNLDRAFESAADTGVDKATETGAGPNLNRVKESAKANSNLQGAHLLGFEGTFMIVDQDGQSQMMLELALLGVRGRGSAEIIPNVEGLAADVVSSVAMAGLGGWLIYNGTENADELSVFIGMAVVSFSVLEFDFPVGTPDVVPMIKVLGITKIGVRWACFSEGGEDKMALDILVDAKIGVGFNNVALAQLAGMIAELLGLGNPSPVELFGEALDNIVIGGELNLEVKNIQIPLTDKVPESLKKFFGVKEMAITAKDIPTIAIKEDDDAQAQTKPKKFDVSLETRFVKKNFQGVEHYGITLGLTGITIAGVTALAPVKGFTILLYPTIQFILDFEFKLPQEIIIFYPGTFLAKGRVALDKPLPSGKGTQNVISVGVGFCANRKYPPQRYDEYLNLEGYRFQAEGTIVWGEAQATHGDVTAEYPFSFVSFGLQFVSPAPVPTPMVGVLGGGVVFGKNVAPGSRGEGAEGLARWISSGSSFRSVLGWGNAAEEEWHPDQKFDAGEGDFVDNWNAGVVANFADVPSSGSSFTAEGLILIGMNYDGDAFRYLAIGAHASLPKAKLNLTLLIAIDPVGFVVRVEVEMKLKEDGRIYNLKFPIEFGAQRKKFWGYIGHYLDSKGGPATAELLDSLFEASFYVLFSQEELTNFGLNPFNPESGITIPGPAFGLGFLNKFGPKTYGPSWLHLKIFAAMGANLGVYSGSDERSNEFMVFAEAFMGGAVTLKVIIFKFELSLLASLQVILNQEGYGIFGELVFVLSLSWPFDDIRAGVDFVIQSDAFVPIPPLEVQASLTAHARFEGRAFNFDETGPEVLPIDAVLVLTIARKIQRNVFYDEPAVPGIPGDQRPVTLLALLDNHVTETAILETVKTQYQGLEYLLQFDHQLENPRLSFDGNTVPILFSTWKTPALDEGLNIVPNEESTQSLYLNSLFPVDEQFNSQRLLKFHAWSAGQVHASPCETFEPVCLSTVVPLPAIDENARFELEESWANVVMRGVAFRNILIGDIPFNSQPFETSGPDNAPTLPLQLAYFTEVNTSQSVRASVTLEFILEIDEDLEIPTPKPEDRGGIPLAQLHVSPRVLFDQLIDRLSVYVKISLVDGTEITATVVLQPPLPPALPPLPAQPGDLDDLPILEVEFVTAQFDGWDNNSVEASVVEVAAGKARFSLDFTNVTKSSYINGIQITGWTSALRNPQQNNPFLSTPHQLWILKESLKASQLLLIDLCLEHEDQAAWFDLSNFGDDNLEELDGNSAALLDTVARHFLLESNRNYRLDYAIRTHVKIFHVKKWTVGERKEQERELLAEKDIVSSTYENYPADEDLDSTNVNVLPPLLFSTERLPSQAIEAYIGFSFPAAGTTLLYPEQTSPMISLKYLSSIRRIFSEHHDQDDVLRPRVVYAESLQVIEMTLESKRIGESTGVDQYAARALECAEPISGILGMDIYTLSRELDPKTDYCLQLFYSGGNDEITPVQFSAPFATSAFVNVRGHSEFVQDLTQTTAIVTLMNSAQSIDLISAHVQAALGGQIQNGLDQMIEKIYQDALGIQQARFTTAVQSQARWIVDLDLATGQTINWGLSIELAEPLLHKAGVSLPQALRASEAASGVYFLPNDVLLLSDATGTRLLIFKASGVGQFEVLDDLIDIRFASSSVPIWEQMITTYVNQEYRQMSAQERTDVANNLRVEMEAIDALNGNELRSEATLQIAVPNTNTD